VVPFLFLFFCFAIGCVNSPLSARMMMDERAEKAKQERGVLMNDDGNRIRR
jgi:hypothetical protein